MSPGSRAHNVEYPGHLRPAAARERLNGCVEVDETYLAILDRQAPISSESRNSSTSKIQVILAVELLEPKGFGRIRLRRIDRDTQDIVIGFVQEVVEPGARIRTDGSPSYQPLRSCGYQHEPKEMLRAKAPAHEVMPGVRRVASLLKRWILGTHHGAIQPPQLDHYFDEFVF